MIFNVTVRLNLKFNLKRMRNKNSISNHIIETRNKIEIDILGVLEIQGILQQAGVDSFLCVDPEN